MNDVLAGTFRGKSYRLKVECYSKTPEIKVQLIPTDGSDRITLTQNLGQTMPLYQAFLGDGILDIHDSDFMDYMEKNRLGRIVDFKRYDPDVFTGQLRRMAAIFQFNSSALRRYHAAGCTRYESHYTSLKRRYAERRARRMAG